MSYSGQSLKRFEDHVLVTGAGSFVDDIKLPTMLHAYVVRSPHAHARIRSIDVSVARNQPAVVAVLTGADLDVAINTVPGRPMEDQATAPAQGTSEDVFNAPHQPVLATDKVCYVGQPVAIIVAKGSYPAGDAAELIQVDYELLPPLLDPFESMRDDSLVMHRDLGTNLGLRIFREGGDLEGAFARADRIVQQSFHVQRLAPAPLETRGVVADYQAQGDSLTVWDSTQAPHRLWRHLTRVLGRAESGVRVIAPDVGGGFGEKGSLFAEEIAVPYLSLKLGAPVKWVESRQDNMLAFHGRGHTVDVEATVKNDGTILGIRVRVVADLGAFFLSSTPWVPPLLAAHRIAGPYKTLAMSVEVLGVITNKPPTGPHRGAGGPESAFCMERTVDLIAKDLGLDPVEVRRKNFIPPESFPYTTPASTSGDWTGPLSCRSIPNGVNEPDRRVQVSCSSVLAWPPS